MNRSTNSGFTLLEMLVVCLIVVLLAGIVFRMVGAIGRANDNAATKASLERVANALEEFKSIYGKYPPVRLYKTNRGMMPIFGYEFPQWDTYGTDETHRREVVRRLLREGQGNLSKWQYGSGHGEGNAVFTFGLCSFFVPRVNGTAENGGKEILEDKDLLPEQWTSFNTGNERGDSQRDLDAVRRILPHLGESLNSRGRVDGLIERHNPGILTVPWDGFKRLNAAKTNDYCTIRDAWGNDLVYYSIPPYESYKLWSAGPDGMTVGDKCAKPAHGHKKAPDGEYRVADGDQSWNLIIDG